MCKSYSHFFSKSTCELDIVLTRTVNILTTNELVKLMKLLTTGPCCGYLLMGLHWYFPYFKYSLQAPHWGTSNEHPQYVYSRRNKKIIFIWVLLISRAMFCKWAMKALSGETKKYACFGYLIFLVKPCNFFFMFSKKKKKKKRVVLE